MEVVSPRVTWSIGLVEEIRMLFLNQEMEGRGEPAAEQEMLVGWEVEMEVMGGGKVVMETWLGGWSCLSRPVKKNT